MMHGRARRKAKKQAAAGASGKILAPGEGVGCNAVAADSPQEQRMTLIINVQRCHAALTPQDGGLNAISKKSSAPGHDA